MPAPENVDQFVELLERSQLLAPKVLANLREQMRERKFPSARNFAKTLRRSNVLTPYQAARLLNGEADGFYLAKFKILDVLGRGGMGTVYLAEQITMHRLVAIKVMKNVGTGQRRLDYLTRFTREARAVAALNHPNIIRAFDFDEINGQPYIVMEYIEGLNAEQQVMSLGPLSWGQAADYLRQAAEGLEHASQAKLVHRDIKPGNLLVDREGCVKILDLGLVANLKNTKDSDSLTTDAEHLGTVDYIAPEQALDSHAVDIRADIYSLGASFYYLVTGKPMFPAMSTSQKLLAQQMQHPKPLVELLDGIPKDLSELVCRMIAKKPEDRPQTPREVADALTAFSRPKSPPYDLAAVTHSQQMMSAFLRKSPHPSTISSAGVSASGVNTAVTPSKSRSSKSQVAGVPAKSKRALAVQAEPHSGDDWWDKDVVVQRPKRLEAPPRRDTQSVVGTRRKRGTGKNKKKANSGLPLWGILAGVCALAGIVAAVVFATSGSDPDPTDLNPSLAGKSSEAKTTVAKSTGGEPSVNIYKQKNLKRQAYRAKLRDDPSVALMLVFDTKPQNKIIRSKANNSPLGKLKLNVIGGPSFVSGRHGGHFAAFFEGKQKKQRFELNDQSSKWLNFDSSYSIAVWFRSDGFQTNYETLISKGNASWRMQRKAGTRQLEFATNPFIQNGIPEKSQVRVFSKGPVDDDRWHLAVGVVDLNQNLNLRLYVDGELHESKTLFVKHMNSNAQVMIGGNSEYLGFDRNGNQIGKHPGNRFFRGLIDEVVIFQRALTDPEVAEMYDAGSPVRRKK